MSGQYAIKGYLIQSLVALLDSFESDWETVRVEPNNESEKVDISWIYKDGKKKVIQVKSSINLMTLSSVKKWVKELEEGCLDANEYELTLVGRVADKIYNLKDHKIDNVVINNKDISLDEFETLIISKINSFFEKKGKNAISPQLGKLFSKALNQQILQNSIIGKSVSFIDFENSLLDSLQAIERHLEKSAYSLLLSDTPNTNEDIKSTIINHILNLIGWTTLNKDETITLYNEKLDKNENFTIDYWGNYDSPLKDNIQDVVFVNTSLEAEYPIDFSNTIKQNTFCVDLIRKALIERRKISPENAIEHCVQFILSLKNTEQDQGICGLKECFKSKLLNKEIVYYSIDNKKANFLISSIITAKKYRTELVTKFLYPITEENSKIEKIGKRGTYLPPQYINSSILPVIKEDTNKISVLLFCADPYSKERFRKILWLLIRLTSGLANEYIVYFPDFNSQYQNEINEIIRSYKNNDLTSRVRIEQLMLCNAIDLQIIPSNLTEDLKDEDFDDTANKNKKLLIQPHLIEYLPYGDSIKPFLASDAVKSDDLKLFLENKGVFFKTADKTKIIQLMTSMLFSSLDIESLVNFVNINGRSLECSFAQYPLIDENALIGSLTSNNMINQNILQDGLKADIISVDQIQPTNSQDSYVIKMHLEQKNPNKQALVSIARSIAQVTIKIDQTTKKLEFTKEYNSRPARTVAERVVKQLSDTLIRQNIIEDKCIDVCFSEFSNRERVNFLLSFTNIESSFVFKKFNAKSFKFMYDEGADLPIEYQDKKDKECVTQLHGKNLDTINELQDNNLKDILLGEELAVTYRYDIRGICGNYFVIINFSDALKNKPIPDGIFNFRGKVYIDSKSKQMVSSIQTIENELKKEFNRLRKEKLQQFNKI